MKFSYRAVDAFCGAGGMGLGLSRAGFDISLSFDNDPVCIATQQLNATYFNHQAIQVDIGEMLGGGLLKRLGLKPKELFLLAGGPPCQGFSIQRIGKDDDIRNDLVIKYMELVEEVMPHYFLMENVPGINGKRGKKIFSLALEIAESIGYWVHTKTLNAQSFGVPQRRKRVFVVGERKDDKASSFQFPIGSANSRNVRETIGHLPPPPPDGSDHPDLPHHRRDMLSKKNIARLEALKQGQGRDFLPDDLLTKAHKISSNKIGHRNVYGRMKWDTVAPTITARFDSFTRGQFGHPEQNRSISLLEGALLQSFPEDFKFSGTKVEIARQIGNAVPPLLAHAIGSQILACHSARLHSE